MLECPKTARMKDFLKLFKTVIDFKGLSFIVTEQPFNKKLRPVFSFATVKLEPWDWCQMKTKLS